jgi:hypothetical protein
MIVKGLAFAGCATTGVFPLRAGNRRHAPSIAAKTGTALAAFIIWQAFLA